MAVALMFELLVFVKHMNTLHPLMFGAGHALVILFSVKPESINEGYVRTNFRPSHHAARTRVRPEITT